MSLLEHLANLKREYLALTPPVNKATIKSPSPKIKSDSTRSPIKKRESSELKRLEEAERELLNSIMCLDDTLPLSLRAN